LKKIFVILFVILICLKPVYPQSKVLDVGEELVYRVYFGFIKLGEVNVKMSNKTTSGGQTVYYAIASIKSYDGIPFVSLNYKFQSEMISKKSDFYSQYFNSTEFKKKSAEARYNSVSRTDYNFDHENEFIKVKKETDMEVERDDTVKFEKLPKFQDGLSMYYNARIGSLKPKLYKVPVYMNEEESSVNYSFNMNEDVVSTDCADYDIAVIKIEGVALFKGLFGLTGEFTGWLSNDDYRVPIKANFNVVIGKISMELVSYKKTGWTPPKSSN
jgi:hypothetical protein